MFTHRLAPPPLTTPARFPHAPRYAPRKTVLLPLYGPRPNETPTSMSTSSGKSWPHVGKRSAHIAASKRPRKLQGTPRLSPMGVSGACALCIAYTWGSACNGGGEDGGPPTGRNCVCQRVGRTHASPLGKRAARVTGGLWRAARGRGGKGLRRTNLWPQTLGGGLPVHRAHRSKRPASTIGRKLAPVLSPVRPDRVASQRCPNRPAHCNRLVPALRRLAIPEELCVRRVLVRRIGAPEDGRTPF